MRRLLVALILVLGLFAADALVAGGPAMATEDKWTSRCSRQAAGDVLAYLEGTRASCSVDAGTQSFNVSTAAHAEGPGTTYYVSNCEYAGVNHACAVSSAVLTVEKNISILPSYQSITANLENLAVSTANSAGYSSGGRGYSEVKVTFYGYAYSCDWNWYAGWKCYYGKSTSKYLYLSCAPVNYSCNTNTTSMTLDVEVPYCNGYYCSTEWSRDSPYARIVGTITVQARSTAVGSIRSAASATGSVYVY